MTPSISRFKKISDLKVKEPFRRVCPSHLITPPPAIFTDGNIPPYDPGISTYFVVTQADFKREYEPSGHDIWDPRKYPDITRLVDDPVTDGNGNPAYDENGNALVQSRVYVEKVPRYAFAFQQIISYVHITNMTGNDIQFEIAKPEPEESDEKLFNEIHASWMHDGMEELWYEAYKSRENTGDAAFIAMIDENNNIRGRVFSYEKGDVLYPHYNEYGELDVFARVSSQYNDIDGRCTETIEVWDNVNHYVYRHTDGENRDILETIRTAFGSPIKSEGYTLIKSEGHGFDTIPVCYMRDNGGPGWTPSQDAIDSYELSYSQMAHNNQAFGEAILVLQSKSELPPNIVRGLDGSIKELDLGEEDKASFLPGQSASEGYREQLEKTEEMIYRGSNIVKSPTELKSGDTPATAIKLLFTPNLNYAKSKANECKAFVQSMWNLYAYAYGRTHKQVLDCKNLPVTAWVLPYLHVNESAIVADAVSLTANKIISRQTAAEMCSFYSKPGEQTKVAKEQKADQDRELLYEQTVMDQKTDSDILIQESQAKQQEKLARVQATIANKNQPSNNNK